MRNYRYIQLMLIVTLLSVLPLGSARGMKSPSNLSVDLVVTTSRADAPVLRVPQDASDLESAIEQVPDGGIIELAAGTYYSPSGGWVLNNLGKGFTVRAEPGAYVTLDGGSSRRIIRMQNTSFSNGRVVVFERIVFAHGYNNQEGLAAAVTMYEAQASFVDCTFKENTTNVATTVGGAVYVAEHSVAYFFNTTWLDNVSRVGGGALGIRSQSKVTIHNSRFTHNLSNPANHGSMAGGGAINAGNSVLRVSNTRFEENQAGAYGGALYIIGSWGNSPYTTPQADAIVVNSTFINNQALRHPTVSDTFPTEGGAVNVEDQSVLKVYNSRFYTNSANIAGGVNNFRAKLEIYGSVFLGNLANDTRGSSGFGGAISLNSSDGPGDGADNKPSAELLLEDSWLQGRYGSVTTTAISGACLFATGDGPRLEDDGVPNVGTLDENRAKVTVRRTAFYDCDSRSSGDGSKAGAGGGLYISLTNLSMEDSLISKSDVFGSGASGGGLLVIYNSLANVSGTTFARNTSETYGGAIYGSGSVLNLRNSRLFANEVSIGQAKPFYQSYGAGIFTTVDIQRGLNMDGLVENNLFSKQNGLAIFDDDRDVAGWPYNDLQYNGNQFYETSYENLVFKSALNSTFDPSILNMLTVYRLQRGVNTDKSPLSNNVELTSEPVVGSILAVPPYVLPVKAAGDEDTPAAYVAYAWSGGSATLNGQALSGGSGFRMVSTAGMYTLNVAGQNFNAGVAQGAAPSASAEAASNNQGGYTLSWALVSGSFLDNAFDQGVNHTHTPTGAVDVFPVYDPEYHYYQLAKEGGYLISLATGTPQLVAPSQISVLVGLDPEVNHGVVPLRNAGGGTLTWSAHSNNPELISLETTGGEMSHYDGVHFTVLADTPGSYQGVIVVEGEETGNQNVTVNITVVEHLQQVFLPMSKR